MANDQSQALTRSSIGQSVGHCRILSLLGKGGMGEVWLAEDARLGRQVAIKLLPAAFTSQPERVRRFARPLSDRWETEAMAFTVCDLQHAGQWWQ